MAQRDIILFLKANRSMKYTAKQLGLHFDVTHNSVATCMKALRRAKLVKFEQVNQFGGAFKYWL